MGYFMKDLRVQNWNPIALLLIAETQTISNTVHSKKYAHGFCFAVLCCGYTLTDFPISIRLTSLALWQSNDCPSASKATLMNMDKYFMWIHYERLHNHNKAKHNKTVCIFLGIYCITTANCRDMWTFVVWPDHQDYNKANNFLQDFNYELLNLFWMDYWFLNMKSDSGTGVKKKIKGNGISVNIKSSSDIVPCFPFVWLYSTAVGFGTPDIQATQDTP